MRVLLLLVAVFLLISISSCSSGVADSHLSDDQLAPGNLQLSALPTDGVQPWEKVDSRGYVIPAGASPANRGTSAFGASSQFIPGVERFNEVGSVTDDGEVSVVVAGSNSLSGGIYRIPMGGVQPSAFAVDVNLHDVAGKPSHYWVGLSDYGRGVWQWYGPYADGQIVKTVVAGSNSLSSAGNMFLTVAGFDDSQFDIVGVTISALDSSDTTPPPTPAAPSAASVAGGIELSWTDVLAGDLAGYQLYWSYSPFAAPTDNGVTALPRLENTTRMVLPAAQPRDVYFAISAVDVNGNESGLSPVQVEHKAILGEPLVIHHSNTSVSLMLGDPLEITMTGAELYDFDTDGDGSFDITGDTSGILAVDTSQTGIIRPRVRGSSSDGKAVAFGSVSLIVSGNQRPVASGSVSPAFGYTPLAVTYTGEGADFDGTIAEYAWDRTGDGIYEKTSAVSGTFSGNLFSPGLYNAKFRVTDDKGAWDVDTVSIQVLPNDVQLTATPSTAEVGDQITLTATASGTVTNYEWDLDGDGSYETDAGATASTTTAFSNAGPHTLAVRVTLDTTGTAEATTSVAIRGWSTHTNLQPGPASSFNSLAIIAGHPAIAFRENTNLRYVRATDSLGNSWGTDVLIETSPGAGVGCKLIQAGGAPAIVYGDSNNGNVRYTRATDAAGANWLTPVTLATSVTAPEPSIAIVQGNPAVTYAGVGSNMDYLRALDATGANWPATSVTVDSAGACGFRSSLAIVNGYPAVSYIESNIPELRYARALDDTGALWNTPVTIALIAGYEVAENPTGLMDTGGAPSIAFQAVSGTTAYLMYVRAVDAAGALWFNAAALDHSGDVSGYFVSTAVIQGNPAILFAHDAPYSLALLRCLDPQGNNWQEVEQVRQTGSLSTNGLIEMNGAAAASYSTLREGLCFSLRY